MAIYNLTASSGSRASGARAVSEYEYLTREGKYDRDAKEVREAESGNMPDWANRPGTRSRPAGSGNCAGAVAAARRSGQGLKAAAGGGPKRWPRI